MKRAKVSVQHELNGEWVAWVVRTGRSWYSASALKRKAVEYAVTHAKNIAPSELYIYGKNGRLQDRRSYGTDPSRTKG